MSGEIAQTKTCRMVYRYAAEGASFDKAQDARL